MTSRALSDQQVRTLEFQTDQLYESFKRALTTQSVQDAIWNRDLFEAFRNSLKEATGYAAFIDWNRNTNRTPIFDKYLLQYFLGSYSAGTLVNQISVSQFGNKKLEPKKTDVTSDTLKQAVDDPNVPYLKLIPSVISLAEAQDFTGIVDAIEYVRKKYQKHTE